jgi:general secretion pathway protein L
MSTLVISLPTRQRLRSRGASPAGDSTSDAQEFAYLLSADGFTVQAQGRCAASLLPKADSVVAVVPDTDIAWHRITLPKAPQSRLRAALIGVLEESLLEDAEATHLALAPGAVAGQLTWVAALDSEWLRASLDGLERHQVFVDRLAPLSWPDEVPHGHFHESPGADSVQDLALIWVHADGVVSLRLQGGLARTLLPQPLPTGVRWTAAPEVATAAERWLGSPVTVQSSTERMLQATRTLWNLRQFDLSLRNRGSRAARDLLRRCLSPAWRPVRHGLIALVAVQLIGLNLWAWHQRSEVLAKRQAMVSLLQTAFPQVRAVLDAPLQMQREIGALRALAGKASETDFEPQLLAAAAAWPAGQPPVDNLRFESGRLTLAAASWSETEVDQFRQRLRSAGWQVESAQGSVTLSRTGEVSR